MSQELLSELQGLISEGRNPATAQIDTLGSEALLRLMNDEDTRVPRAVGAVLPQIARAVDVIVDAFGAGGRLIYLGAGTSGRLGVLDASECPPTFGVPDTMVLGLIAGGDVALRHATEGAEDDTQAAVAALDAIGLAACDVVVGLAASGRTPYVVAALDHARTLGATSIAVACNPGSPCEKAAEIAIVPVVGPEVLTGSTRLKSGTAQKLVLNMLSTASMIRIGKTYSNLMVDLKATNAKLDARATRVVMQATDRSAQEARAALDRTGGDVKLAILILLTGEEVGTARDRLAASGGMLRQTIEGAPKAPDQGPALRSDTGPP